MNNALDEVWPFTAEFFEITPWNAQYYNMDLVRENWTVQVKQLVDSATLALPSSAPFQTGGLRGIHTENLGYILAEMQYLQRVYPGNEW
jgi:ring-1,2-phenylacetyl-CoA epoxidase subunit PaaC